MSDPGANLTTGVAIASADASTPQRILRFTLKLVLFALAWFVGVVASGVLGEMFFGDGDFLAGWVGAWVWITFWPNLAGLARK